MKTKLGATGAYPFGKLNEHDEGELRFAIGADHDASKVVLSFGSPVAWLAMNPQEAGELGKLLIEKAKDVVLGRSRDVSPT